MKKLFMFLAVAGLAAFGTSCSSDDNKGGGDGGKDPQLVAKADPSNAKVGQEVKFSATADGKAVDGVDFYVGDTKLSNPHKFTEAKEYKVVAKKKGYIDSATITVKVTEENGGGDPDPDPIEEALTIELENEGEIYQGDTVSFLVLNESALPAGDAEVYVNGNLIEGRSFVATEKGEYTAYAKKGEVVSEEVTFEVLELVLPEGEGTVTYNGEHKIAIHTVFHIGAYWANEEQTEIVAVWQYESLTEDDVLTVTIAETPAWFVDESTYDLENPNGTNTEAWLNGIFVGDAEPIVTEEGITSSLKFTAEDLNENGFITLEETTTIPSIGYTLEFDGESVYGSSIIGGPVISSTKTKSTIKSYAAKQQLINDVKAGKGLMLKK